MASKMRPENIEAQEMWKNIQRRGDLYMEWFDSDTDEKTVYFNPHKRSETRQVEKTSNGNFRGKTDRFWKPLSERNIKW